MISSNILNKYYDSKLKVISVNGEKTFDSHKIILANYSKYFENLFDFDNKQEYEINIPFQIEIFEEIYNNIYEKSCADIIKDINYYENKLYALYFLCYNQKDIDKILNNIILEIDSNIEIDVQVLIKNLNDFSLIPNDTKSILLNRITLDKFIENYYDKDSKKLVLTDHLTRKNFNVKYIDVENIRFSVYSTNRYDIDQIGFWIDYTLNSEYTGEKSIKGANGSLIIYNGINIIKHKLKKLSRDDRYTLTFEGANDRYGYVEEYVTREHNFIDSRICAYKIILDFF